MKGEKNMNEINYKDIATLGTLFFKNFDDEMRIYYLAGKMGEDKYTVTRIGMENLPESKSDDDGLPIFSLDNFCHYSGFFIKIIE